MTTDYKSTVFLPQTDFPMKAGLPKREPEILRRWEKMDIQARHREAGNARFSPRGSRWITTFKKLPKMSPKATVMPAINQ